MFTHHVLFWLSSETTDDQKHYFKQGLESLEPIETVKSIFIGTPASTNRPVIDTTYTFSLLLVFEDLAGHDTYQTHPIHEAFVEKYKPMFEKVIIYDSQ